MIPGLIMWAVDLAQEALVLPAWEVLLTAVGPFAVEAFLPVLERN